MKNIFNKIRKNINRRTWITLIIVFAAFLIELFSAVQYYYTKHILEEELENKASIEMTMKAIIIKSMLKTTEQVLDSHATEITKLINNRDDIDESLRTIFEANDYFEGVGLAFVPGYYEGKDELYEPWIFYSNQGAKECENVAQRGGHDYTTLKFYTQPISTGKPYWSDPYIDSIGTPTLITTYSIPIFDKKGEKVAVAGIDLSLEWLSDTLNNRHTYPSSYCMLLTDDAQLISQLPKSDARFKDVDQAVKLINDSTNCIFHIVSNSKIKVIEFTNADGQDACVFFHHMKGNPHWMIALVCYDNEVFAGLNEMRLRTVLLMLLGFMLLGYIIYLFLKNNKRMARNELEHERLNSELLVAKRIQSEMLPHDALTHDNFDIAALLLSAREVGGDIYDYFLRDDKLFFCIGDASGKGVASALVMSVTHSMFRSFGSRESHPARIMQKINQAVCHGNDSSMFVTIFIGVLDLPTGRLQYCNAGHDTPLLIDDKPYELDVKSNIPLGVDVDWFYEGQQVVLRPGSTLLLYTDGLTEAMNVKHDQLGLQSVKDTIAQHLGDAPQQLLDALHRACAEFVAGAEQSDDLTMLAVKFAPLEEVTIMHRKLAINNSLSHVHEVNDFVKSIGEELNLAENDSQNLKLAIEEAVVNVINYAYPTDEEGKIDIEATATPTYLRVKIIDSGVPFAPTDAPDVDTSLSAEERQIGGLGIFLVRQLMDTINYERIDGKNILTLTKKLTG